MRGRASKATRRNRCLSCRLNDGLSPRAYLLFLLSKPENSSYPLRRNGISFHFLEAIQNKIGQNVSRRNLQKERATQLMRNGCSVVPAHPVRDGSMQVTESR